MDTLNVQTLLQGYKQIFDALFFVDVKTREEKILFFFNSVAERWLSTAEDYNGINASLIPHIAPAYRKGFLQFKDLDTLQERIKHLHKNEVLSYEYLFNEIGWVRISILPLDYDEKGNIWHIFITHKCINNEVALRRQAQLDLLTGLYNRITAEKMICQRRKDHKPGILIFTDCDKLKDINDHCGHQVGDRCIIGMAHSLKSTFPDAITFRIGGDEMGVYLEGSYTDEQLHTMFTILFEKVVKLNHSIKELEAHGLHAYLSVGAVFNSGDASITLHELFHAADKCMYRSKRTVGNTYFIAKSIEEASF